MLQNFQKKSYFYIDFFLHLLYKTNRDAAVAQLVEQRTENPCVKGSIPFGGTKAGCVAHNRLFYFSAYL